MTLSTCRVAGFPEIRAYEPSGRLANIAVKRSFFLDSKLYAYAVTPGAAVFFALYGNPPRGEFDRDCVGIGQIDVRLPGSDRPIDVTLATGTCGRRLTVSQFFPAAELSH